MHDTLRKSGTLGRQGAPSAGQIAGRQGHLGHATLPDELHKQIRRLLAEGLVTMTLPGKPQSRLQRSRLTERAGQVRPVEQRS